MRVRKGMKRAEGVASGHVLYNCTHPPTSLTDLHVFLLSSSQDCALSDQKGFPKESLDPPWPGAPDLNHPTRVLMGSRYVLHLTGGWPPSGQYGTRPTDEARRRTSDGDFSENSPESVQKGLRVITAPSRSQQAAARRFLVQEAAP